MCTGKSGFKNLTSLLGNMPCGELIQKYLWLELMKIKKIRG